MKIIISESQYRILTENRILTDTQIKLLNHLFKGAKGKVVDNYEQIKKLAPIEFEDDFFINLYLMYNGGLKYAIKNGGNFDGITNFKFGGSLNLYNTSIESLPDGLTVGGSLNLYNTSIESLPDGLTVGGSLNLGNTSIKSLPDGLTVGGDLYIQNTFISKKYDERQIIKMIEDHGGEIKGNVYI